MWFSVAFLSTILCESAVKIITREGCGWSRLMRGFLKERNVPYEDINTSYVGTQIKKDMGVEDATFPAVFLNGEYLGGYIESTRNPKLLNFIGKKENLKDDIVI